MTTSSVDIQAVSRVGEILALFGPSRQTVTSAEVAQLTGVNRTTTYRYLASLVAAGLLENRPGRSYGPGPTLLQLGTFALSQQDVLLHAPGLMAALAERTHITTVLSLWGTRSPVVAHVEESIEREVLVTVRVGMHLRSNAAQASIFYAYRGDDKEVRSVIESLPAADRERVQRVVAEVHENGFAGAISERGIAVLAAPIWDNQRMVASLGLLSTRDVLDTSTGSAELALLRDCAREISEALGSGSRA